MVLKHAVVAVFRIYAQRCVDAIHAAKRGGWRSCIKSWNSVFEFLWEPLSSLCSSPGSKA